MTELAGTMILFFFLFPKRFSVACANWPLTGLGWDRARVASVAGDPSDFFACQLRVGLTQCLRQTYTEHMSTFIYSFNEVNSR